MKYRELRKKLRSQGVQEEKEPGKGSHRTFTDGKTSYPLPYHGDNEDVKPCYLRALERIFHVKLR